MAKETAYTSAWTATISRPIAWSAWLWGGGLYVLFGLLVLPPMGFVVWTSLKTGHALSLAAYEQICHSKKWPRLWQNTLEFALGSTGVAAGLGLLMAWLVERTDSLGRAGAYTAVFAGVAIPGMVRVIGWILLMTPKTGVVNLALRRWLGAGAPSLNIETMGGMIAVEGLFWAPMAFLLLSGPIRHLDQSLEGAAIASGATCWRVHLLITWRLLAPSVLSVMVLTFIRAVQGFEVPLFLGVPGNVPVIASSIYIGLEEAFVPDYATASAYGVLMLAFLFAVLGLYAYVTRFASRHQTVAGKGFRFQKKRLGSWRWAGGVALWAIAGVQLLPALYMILASFLKTASIAQVGESLTLANYRELMQFPGIVGSVLDSLAIGLVTGTAAVLLALAISWAMRWYSARGLASLVNLPLVFPGVVMSLAMLVMALHLPIPLYGSIWIFVVAYVATFTPYALRYIQPALLQIHPELEEVARTGGVNQLVILLRLLLPLLRQALLGAWIFIFLISLRELAVASLLYTAHTQVIATQLLDMWVNGNLNVLSAFGTIITAVGVTVGLLVWRIGGRQVQV